MKKLIKTLRDTQTNTWVGHAVATLMGPLIISLILHHYFPMVNIMWVFVVLTGMFASYFVLHRERMDRLKHKLKGDYKTPDEIENITPKVDRVGDSLGPISVFVSSLVTALISLM